MIDAPGNKIHTTRYGVVPLAVVVQHDLRPDEEVRR